MDSTSEATEEAPARPEWRTWAWWREGYRQKRWFIIGAMAVITVGLGLYGLGQVHPKSSRPPYLDRAYDIVNLFHFSTPTYTFTLPWALEVARWLAPFTLILAGLGAISAIFNEQFTQVRVYFLFRNHLVICGAGRVGMRLTASFREPRRGERRNRVVVIDHHPLIADLEECRRLGVPVLTGDATDPVMLKRARVNRAEHLIAVSGDNGVNAEIALQVATVATRKNHHLTCYVNVDDQELSLLLDETARFDAIHLSASSGATIVYRFFNILQQGPETLLREREYLLHPGDGVDPSLLVVGGGPIAIGLVVEAARQWQKTSTTSVKLRITVADTDAEALVQGVHQRSKDLHMVCDLVPLVLNPWDPYVNPFALDHAGNLPTPTAAIVCPLDDAAGLRASIKLWNRLPGDVPVVVCTTGRMDTAPLLQLASVQLMHNVEGFPILDRVCRSWVDLVIGTPNEIEVLARKVHEAYLSHRFEDPEARLSGDPSLATWDSLPADLRQSNRDQVVDFKRKLRCIGLTYIPAFGEVSEPYVLPADQVERLAEMEHDRWIAERLAGGWTYGEKDIADKTSPSLVCWNCLTKEMQDFDRNAMKEYPALLRAEDYIIGTLKGPPDPDDADKTWQLPSTWSCPVPTHDTELLARAIHDDYLRRHQAENMSSADDPSLLPWVDLPEDLRQSNRDQAADIEAKLAAISYEAVKNVEGADSVTEFSPDEVEQLACLEHDRWVRERIKSGWTLGPAKDVEAKRSPYLVPWEKLTEEVRDLDRDTVRRIPQFLAELELVIVRRRHVTTAL
jgi:voltage-gated potassium channel Kch